MQGVGNDVPPMGELTAEQIAQRTLDLNLLDDRQLTSVWGDFGRRNVTADEFLNALVRRELLTNYQVERLIKGDRSGYFYGPYKVLYRVATGSFARVYRAVEAGTGKIVALKVLRFRFSDKEKETDQFYREGMMGKSLRHPNIVPIYDVVSQGTTHFIVMEFVEGHNLRLFVRTRRKIAADEATKIMIDIASGMAYAHDHGISHRDLKMTNVLISSRGQARLIDFGLAGAEDVEDEDANPRTIDYAGLERATGVRKDDPRSDIYFMGCIYYNLLTGVPPLQETKDRIQRLSRQRYLEVKPIREHEDKLPKAVMMIVEKAMQLDADRRYQTPAEMYVDLSIAAKKMAAGEDIEEVPEANGESKEQLGSDRERERWAAMLIPEEKRRVLLFVESNPRMQDIFRDGLKRSGYRVLLTSDPERALSRFEDNENAADCVIFSSGTLGSGAVKAFNALGKNEATAHIPAILLLGETQKSWKKKVKFNDHRVAVSMPIKLRQFRSLLAKLVPPVEADDARPA